MLELFVKQLLCSTDAGIGEPFIFVSSSLSFGSQLWRVKGNSSISSSLLLNSTISLGPIVSFCGWLSLALQVVISAFDTDTILH